MRNCIFIKIIVILFSTSLLSQTQKKKFTLTGLIHGNYEGYLYLHYGNIKDSCIVINNKFHFKGNLSKVEVGYFSISRAAGMDKDFYLENENINIDITFEKKTVNKIELDWITINSIEGTETSLIEKDYEAFRRKYYQDKDWQIKNYRKLDEIVSKYPSHPYSLDLLSKTSWDSSADDQKLQNIWM
ncbi:DUF4369 domain-containing protein [Flavobacterium collinsii]|uniref:DUF4369 domain-containing protein n=1 Tax=Flavobacterium collinsii TaxID=1114861 RepID=A0ABN7EJA2_9FLAO|nr:DUF4369 domain-containing protein [Flavobacterium collinsii]CAA9197438.1 hypothetical protein FLACOL7796_01663 [Flavobacterium collinsii]